MKEKANRKPGYCGSGFKISPRGLLCPSCGRDAIEAEWFAAPKDNQMIRVWCNCGVGSVSHFDCRPEIFPFKDET